MNPHKVNALSQRGTVGCDRVENLVRHLIGLNARGKGVKELRERHDPKGENVGRVIKRTRQVNIFLACFQVKTNEATQLKKGKTKFIPTFVRCKVMGELVSRVLMTYTELLTLNLYILNKNSLEQFSPNNPKC